MTEAVFVFTAVIGSIFAVVILCKEDNEEGK